MKDKLANLIRFYQIIITTVILFLLFFQVSLSKLGAIPNFTDELILVLILSYSMYRAFFDTTIRKLMLIYWLAFLFFTVLSLPSIGLRGPVNVLLQVFIHLKFILFIVFLWAALGAKYASKVSIFLLVVTIIGLIYNLLSGDQFNQLFDVITQKRGGNVRPIGIQSDTASLGTTLALFGCLFITAFKDMKLKAFLIIVFSLLIILSTVRTALLLIPLIALWWFKDSIKSFAVALVFVFVGAIFFSKSNYVDELIDITVQNIEWTVDSPVESGYIRGIMIYFSFELANSRFPIGTGAATYGTVTSDDSHIYAEIGLHNSRFFVEKEGIYDSNFASLLGEFGYLGMVVFYLIFLWVIKTLNDNNSIKKNSEFQFVFYLLVCGYSIATPIFMNTYPAFILALVLISSFKLKFNHKDQYVASKGNTRSSSPTFSN